MSNWKDGYGSFDEEGMSTGKKMTPKQRRRFLKKTRKHSKLKLTDNKEKSNG